MEDDVLTVFNVLVGLSTAIIALLLGFDAAIGFVVGIVVALLYRFITNRA